MNITRPARMASLALLTGAAVLLGAAGHAAAQQEADDLRPPTPSKAERVPILSYAVALVVIVAPLAVNFISSKRGHQD